MEHATSSRPFSKTDTNILKGIAILMMYLHHLFYSADTPGMELVNFWLLPEKRVIAIAQMCKLCVATFVFLTAYGTTLSFGKRLSQQPEMDCFRYSLRRYFSMMTGFWLVFVDCQLVSFFTERTRASIYGKKLVERCYYTVIDGFGLAKAFGTPTYNATWWYMSLAALLVFLVPPLILLAKRLRWSLIPLTILIPRLFGGKPSSNGWRYLLPVVLGILLAQEGVFEQIGLALSRNKSAWLAAFPVLSAGALFFMLCVRRFKQPGLFEAPAVLCLALLVYLHLSRVPLLNKGLELLGEHSMNLFLTHTLIKAYFLNHFSYGFAYPELILLVLVADTLVLSFLLNAEKRLITKGFQALLAHHPHTHHP
ncbi:MAG: acyltransferase [Oscillospiraceae bacterium]|nr:acyltransferase [Oscillospiraceae bacterium]